MKKPVLAATGLSGFLGKSIASELIGEFQVIDLFNKNPLKNNGIHNIQLDLLQISTIQSKLRRIKPDAILHLAAATHIDHCQLDKRFGVAGAVWKLNVEATREIAEYAETHATHLTVMSTECVFDGNRSSFSENDAPNPKNWYGSTKHAAENIIRLLSSAAIVRAVIAYNSSTQLNNIYGRIFSELKNRNQLPVVSDQVISPTHTSLIASALIKIISGQLNGIFHISPTDTLTPYQFARLIAHAHSFDESLLKPVTLHELFGSRRSKLRLKHAVLDSAMTMKRLHIQPQTTIENIARTLG